MIIEIQFWINVNTKYFNTRCWFQIGIFNNDIQIAHFLIISTHEHSLKFGRVGCELIFREPLHFFSLLFQHYFDLQDVLVSIGNAMIICIIIYIDIIVEDKHVIYEHIEQKKS